MQLDNLAATNASLEDRRIKRNRDFYMEEEETLSYAPGIKPVTLNTDKTVFRGIGEIGINNAKSIFDSQAIFNTRK